MDLTFPLPAGMVSTLERLRYLCQWDGQTAWRVLPGSPWELTDWETYPLATVNDKGYVVWEKGGKEQWYAQVFTVPPALQTYPLEGFELRLALTWWAQVAEVFVNGQLVQEGDLFDSKARILLTSHAEPGQRFEVALRLVSPGHDIGGIMAAQWRFERPYPQRDPLFMADEWQVLADYLTAFNPEALGEMETALTQIPWEVLANRETFDQCLETCRKTLLPLTTGLKNQTFHLLGHAHLDMAWLWPLAETWDVGERTFRSVIQLQQEFPDLKFGHTSPALYHWIEENRPKLFTQIQQAVAAGRWELLGGMWVEPDMNLISGESIARQLLYGQRYFISRFGRHSTVAWLPDSFGFCHQLPQFLKQADINYFVTGKLHWNDTNPFPHGAFNWRSPDGTEILTVMGPPNLAGVMDTQPIPMARYGNFWQTQTGLTHSLWLPGVGDHGGGPSRDMWQVKQRWQESEFFPNITTNLAEDTLKILETQLNNLSHQGQPIPQWDRDLYLELHRGCYTVHADQKAYNRRSENLLYEAELWSSFASWSDPDFTYPQEILQDLWEKVLLNQFHDILPGTSIPDVFTQANKDWETVIATAQSLIHQALDHLTPQLAWPDHSPAGAVAYGIFNPSPWPQTQVIEIDLPHSQPYQVRDWSTETTLPCQTSAEGRLLILVTVPPLTYQGLWLIPDSIPHSPLPTPTSPVLDNGLLRVTVDPKTGDLASVYHYALDRELLAGPGNELQFFQDQGQYWDAWNIDPQYETYPLPSATLKAWEWLEEGPVRWRLRVQRETPFAQFTQDYELTLNSPVLTIKNRVHWQGEHILAKVAFPLNLTADQFTTEVPCGVMTYPTQPQTPQEMAQWEVPHHFWVDLTDHSQTYGVSLINNNKYGCDVRGNCLRLTLLRGAVWPDPQADRGDHEFIYQLYPHSGDWRSENTVAQGYALNRPLRVHSLVTPAIRKSPVLPSQSWLSLGSENLALMALKRQEDHRDQWVLRCYETQGKLARLTLTTPFPYQPVDHLNLLETPLNLPNSDLTSAVHPSQVITLLLKPHAP